MATYASINLDQVDPTTGEAIRQVVAAALDVLRQQELQLPRIEIEPLMVPMPASVLAYMLYEDESRTSTIIDLNSTENPVLIEDEATVLTGV